MAKAPPGNGGSSFLSTVRMDSAAVQPARLMELTGAPTMMQKFTAMLAAFAFAAATFTPVTASAQRRHYDGYDGRGGYNCQNDGRDNSCRRGYRGRGYDCNNDGRYGSCDRYGRYRDRDDDDGDAIAAGVVGLVLGAVIASAVSNSNNNSRAYSDNGYDSREAYEREYGVAPDDGYYGQQCTQQVRRWDERSGRYVIDEVPC
jgi:hypothetical protein